MAQDTMIEAAVTGGLDVSDRYTYVCVLNFSGGVVDEGRGPTTPEALRRRFRGHGPLRLEAVTRAPSPRRICPPQARGRAGVLANTRAPPATAASGPQNEPRRPRRA